MFSHGQLYVQPMFSQGQLYVAISRAILRNGLKTLLIDEDGVCIDGSLNVVFKEIFRNA